LVLKGVTEMSFLVLKRISGNSEEPKMGDYPSGSHTAAGENGLKSIDKKMQFSSIF
jgi:hypothetical protein